MSFIPSEGKIEIVTGDLGSGKTALGVEYGYELLCMGGWVFSNVEWYPEAVRKRMLDEGLIFDPARLVSLEGGTMKDFHRQMKRGTDGQVVMAMIDEAHFDLNARDHKNTSDEFLQFATLCRKLDIWLLFITQDGNDIDKQVRKKITVEINCRNLKEERIFGEIPLPLPFYCRTRWKLYRGVAHHKIGSSEWMLKLRGWGLYNSKALLGDKAKQFEALGVVSRTKLDRVKSGGADWAAVAAGFIAAFLCVF